MAENFDMRQTVTMYDDFKKLISYGIVLIICILIFLALVAL